MARHSASATSAAALANGAAICGVVPAASTTFKLLRVAVAIVTDGNTPSDFQVGVGINRATTRGTQSATATINKFDPLSPASSITSVDTTYSADPTLAATDGQRFGFNSRGGVDLPYGTGTGADDFQSTTGTANPIVLVNRSGAALPANHKFIWTVEWED